VVLTLLIVLVVSAPIAADGYTPGSERLLSVQVDGAPLRPALSSVRWERGFGRLKVEVWSLADTPWFLPLPDFGFFEFGAVLSYLPILRDDMYVRVGAGAAAEMAGLSFAAPFVASAEWGFRPTEWLWSAALLEMLAWGNGVGIELVAPLSIYPDFWLFGALRPAAVLYLVEGTFHVNWKIGFRLGFNRRVAE
jgi:hypothetical protein